MTHINEYGVDMDEDNNVSRVEIVSIRQEDRPPFRGALAKDEWDERVRRGVHAVHPGIAGFSQTIRDRYSDAMRASFPELAPHDAD